MKIQNLTLRGVYAVTAKGRAVFERAYQVLLEVGNVKLAKEIAEIAVKNKPKSIRRIGKKG